MAASLAFVSAFFFAIAGVASLRTAGGVPRWVLYALLTLSWVAMGVLMRWSNP